MSSIETYFSNGKILLSGEYLVLCGSTALALPIKLGQSLKVETFDSSELFIEWNQIYDKKCIFYSKIRSQDLKIIDTNDIQKSNILKNVLEEAKRINKAFLSISSKINVTSNLDFNPFWGFGSSSTFINNISKWAKIDPYNLLHKTIGGSGFDIACANNNLPILYSKKEKYNKVTNHIFPFRSKILFIYTGKKIDSSKERIRFEKRNYYNEKDILEITEISKKLSRIEKRSEFEELINHHENIISSILGKPTIKNEFFSNYKGSIKSLGAWGGDYILATSDNIDYSKKYFYSKGLKEIFFWKDLFSY